jgi:hypothetical protein
MRAQVFSDSAIRNFVSTWLLALFLICSTAGAASKPQVLYLDVTSGPNSGGENNKGAYLSIFGIGFGIAGDLGTNTKVFINDVEVASYRYLGVSKGRSDIQQITVQIGALGNPSPGVALPVKVIAGGVASNTNQTFIVNPGRILFVDNVSGNDATAVVNDVAHPWRYVQTPSYGGAYGAAQPGDFIVLRGKGTNWTDLGNNNSFLRFGSKGGSQPTGTSGTGPITVMSYPTETVRIVNTANYAISGVNRSAGLPYSNYSTWISISGLVIEGDGGAGPIALQVYADYWRVVNNELTAPTATTAKAGGVNGNGSYVSIFGNNIHDIAGTQQENHGVYIDGGSDIAAGTVEIAYNHIYNISGGNCIQQYNNGSNGDFYPTNNLLIHHNVVHNTTKHGLNIADGSGSGFQIYDNIVYNTQYAGIRFNTTDLVGARIFNNTFYNTDTASSSNYGAITNDWTLGSNALDLRNNIFWPHSGTRYNGGSVGLAAGHGTVSNNLWFGGLDAVPTFDASSKTGNPQFVSAGSDFHVNAASPAVDAGSSGVSSVVSNDYEMSLRPQGNGFDIGAYEFASGGSATAPAITTQPANASVFVGQTATFTVAASGSVPLTYRWQKSTDGGATWNDVDASSATYTTSATTAGDNVSKFHCVVSNSAGSATSNAAALTVNLPTVTVLATDASASETGLDSGTFTITRNGSTVAALTVNFTIGGSATNGADYSTVGTSVSISAGSTSANVVVVPLQDALCEGNETVILTIASNSEYTVGAQNTATVVLSDDDKFQAGSALTITPAQPVAGQSIQASLSTNAQNASDVSYTWNFGDGATGSGTVIPSHVYTSAGDYTLNISATHIPTGQVTSTSTVVHVSAAFSMKINFQPAGASVSPGYLADVGAVFADRGNGFSYGWNADNAANSRDRNAPNSPDQCYDTLIHSQKPSNPNAIWELAVPNGSYTVRLVAGDPSYFDSIYKINVESVLMVNGTPSATRKWFEGTQTVNVSDGRLTVSSATGSSNNKLCFIHVQSAAAGMRSAPLSDEVNTTDIVASALNVTHLALKMSLGKAKNGSCTVLGRIPGLPRDFDSNGKIAWIDVGAVIVPFDIDAKGRARNINGTFSLRHSGPKDWIFSASLKKLEWTDRWTDGGLENITVSQKPVNLPITLTLDNVVFAGDRSVKFSAKSNHTGIAR